MKQSVRRQTTIERLEYDPHPGRRRSALAFPTLILSGILVAAFVFISATPHLWVTFACFVVMGALAVDLERATSTPGSLDVETSPQRIESRSARSSGLSATGLLLVSLVPSGVLVHTAVSEGFNPRLTYNLLLLASVLAAISAVTRIGSALRSVDLRLDGKAGLTFSAPFYRRTNIAWDDIVVAAGDRRSMSLYLFSGDVVRLNTRLQRTDHTVLVEIINRCAEHPIARERLGDIILGDLLLNAAPDGTEPDRRKDDRRK